MERRRFLRLTINTALVVGAGAALRYKVLPPGPTEPLADVHALAKQLFASFNSEDRARAAVAYDHPYRQYHNRGVGGGGISGWSLDLEQRQLLTDLFHAGLSQSGRARAPNESFVKWPGVHACNILFCGDPSEGPYQALLTGPHINLRIGGTNREGVAFGGPQVYGDQRGNERQGLPGNLYRSQFVIAQRLFASMNAEQQRTALLETSPIQTQIEVQGRNGVFVGVPVDGLSADSKRVVRELIADILSTYPEADVDYAWQCLDSNGGIDALHASFFRDGEVDGSGQYQIFRLEGPAAVFYFRGAPHVHAFVNVAMHGDAPLSVGEIVAENPRVLEGPLVKDLFERALLAHTGADFAFYAIDSVVGRLRSGAIRTGDFYNLESWQERVATLEMTGADIREKLKRDANPELTYTVATTGYTARQFDFLGSKQMGPLLRDVVIGYVRRRGAV